MNIKIMKKVILIIISLLILIGTNYYTYVNTIEPYEAVGYNNGSIDARMKIVDKLLNISKPMPYCSDNKITEEQIIVSVKTKSIAYTEKNEHMISFCQSQ